jgi:hypothetical protein
MTEPGKKGDISEVLRVTPFSWQTIVNFLEGYFASSSRRRTTAYNCEPSPPQQCISIFGRNLERSMMRPNFIRL